ncbi:MAG: 50S ribosomal protein L25 [Saprospiraceae bacterium]|nr:50S ribosomal protein L25 [Saprospiraceae bacterium]
MQTVSIKGEERTSTGSSAARALRRQGQVPCELYGSKENIHFSVTPNAVKSIVYTPDFKLAEIEVNGTKHKTILKKIQFHPVTDEILHIDFLKLEEGRPLKVMVPIQFEGASPGVRSGGTLTQKLHRVEIRTTPENLIDTIVMDISELMLGESLRVSDIDVPEEVAILNGATIPVATVAIPRALKSADELEEEEEGEEGAGEESEGEAASTEEATE